MVDQLVDLRLAVAPVAPLGGDQAVVDVQVEARVRRAQHQPPSRARRPRSGNGRCPNPAWP
eukprot:6114953-Pyramimonas_sp.AAC.1